MDNDNKSSVKASSVHYDAKSDPGPLPLWLKIAAAVIFAGIAAVILIRAL